MKLVELLAKEISAWPEGGVSDYCCQSDSDTEVFFGGRAGSIFLSERADETEGVTVTRAQWQAERDRQKGGEWKRHRGGKQPVADMDRVEYKFRGGETGECFGAALLWDHQKQEDDVMQYRIISQPQAEEVDESGYQETVYPGNTDIYADECSEGEVDVQFIEAKTDQIDGPIKWRDTIIHCQAIIEDCEREIQRNVDLLDAEGLMMQADSKKAMQHYDCRVIGIEDYRKWKEGDLVTCKVDYNHQFTKGRQYTVTSVGETLGCGRVSVLFDDKGAANGWLANQFEFHSRP